MEKKSEFKQLNEGLLNLGFTLPEAIMESIDDSLDGFAREIKIQLFEEPIDVYDGEKMVSANRISYLLIDNGVGVERLKEVFEFGKKTELRYKSLEDYRHYNGIYHYGEISHINVGTEVVFYSKIENGNWKKISLLYNEFDRKAYLVEERELTPIKLEELIRLCGGVIPEKSGSILHVRGVAKKHIRNLESNDSIKYLEEDLIQALGLTYTHYLNKCPDKNYSLSVNDKRLTGKDIFVIDESIKESLRSKEFANYKITLRDLLDRLDDPIVESTLSNTYRGLFSSDEEYLSQYIEVRLYALSDELKKQSSVSNLEINPPSADYSGFYIRRNNRYIGGIGRIHSICTDHDDYNRFRGEIVFSPLFDKFFEIQINKNRYNFSNVFISALEECIINDEILYNGPRVEYKARGRIKNALKGRFNTDIHNDLLNVEMPKDDKKKLTKVRNRIRDMEERLEVSVYHEDVLGELSSYWDLLNNDNITQFTSKELNKKINAVNKSLKKMEIIVEKLETDFKKDYFIYRNRANKIETNKRLRLKQQSSAYFGLNGYLEPQNEAEMYALLNILTILKPSLLDFKILNFDYKEGIDCLIELNASDYAKLKMEDRLNGKIEDIKEVENYLSHHLDILETVHGKRYSYMEMKMELPQSMNHSMRFVSHILCWERNENITMSTKCVQYDINQCEDTILYDGEVRAKIIYLKEVIKDVFGGEFL